MKESCFQSWTGLGDLPPPTFKCQFPCESGRSQAPRLHQGDGRADPAKDNQIAEWFCERRNQLGRKPAGKQAQCKLAQQPASRDQPRVQQPAWSAMVKVKPARNIGINQLDGGKCRNQLKILNQLDDKTLQRPAQNIESSEVRNGCCSAFNEKEIKVNKACKALNAKGHKVQHCQNFSEAFTTAICFVSNGLNLHRGYIYEQQKMQKKGGVHEQNRLIKFTAQPWEDSRKPARRGALPSV
ncbi:hypothetical protein F511_41283 [Dorcoceras hygrometricum]|uniref:Uncharacterized protein n=1 Tax=Dorcoceras hygrometricum TaxID=472368 RepID=A0A2Z7A9H2_9LAMI|nr:hypothetical protein F511_41283 [Dorcoceras hygrometricum]